MSEKCSEVKLRVIFLGICQVCIDDQRFWKEPTLLYRLSNFERYIFFFELHLFHCFFSDQFYKMSNIYKHNPSSPQFFHRKWLLCLGQHSLRDRCKTPKCQDTNWDKIHGDLAAFAIASSTPAILAERSKGGIFFLSQARNKQVNLEKILVKDQFLDLCGQWQKCHFFFPGLNHILGASRLEPRTKNVLARSQLKHFPCFKKRVYIWKLRTNNAFHL